MRKYFSSNYKNITYPIDSAQNRGLRNAQLGAIHSIASFFTLNDKQTAITVMPTGSGKTAVLMLAPYLLSKDKVLVVTPSILVRGQISEDFQNLETLCRANVFKKSMSKPNVYEMKNKFKSGMIPDLEAADVIVATPQCALSLSESDWATSNITLVEIDEAHHTPAKNWQQILVNLNTATHVLFTATPFRLDRKEIVGEIVYDYPLSKAYADGIFGEIKYIPVLSGEDKDIAIAEKAEEVLFADRNEGLRHYLMVRTDTKDNAETLEKIYRENTDLNLKRIDSSMSNRQVKQYIQQLKDGKLDGIICVDMLGEGFDFPNLKIAAIHVPHKSLASTLQFIGRFARTNATDIGEAKFIAFNDEDLEIENNRLYASDAVWQEMIINMSEGKNQQESENRKYFSSYEGISDNTKEKNISLQSIAVNCHDRIYRVNEFNFDAIFPDNLNVSNRVYRSRTDNTIVGIGINYVAPLWLNGDNRINKIYSLYIVHYQQELRLLHIYSQSHTEAVYSYIVSSFCSKYEKIPKSEIHRILGELSNYEFFNSGMVNRFNESGEAYRILAGSDVSNSIDPNTGRIYSAGHVFCKATNNSDESITIGYSSASKVWSSTYKKLPDYIKWVDEIGYKIANSDIKVKTNTNFDYLPLPEKLDKYPENVFFGDFSDTTYSSPPVIKSHSDAAFNKRLVDFSLKIENNKEKEKITFRLEADQISELFICDLQGKCSSSTDDLYTHIGTTECSLTDYINDNPILFKTYDDTLISGSEIYRGSPDIKIFEQSRIEAVDWKRYGTNTKIEFTEGSSDEISIHDTLRTILRENDSNKYVLYDHGSGEIADFIAIQEDDERLKVRLYHVKKHTSAKFNSSMEEVYEVAGQAVKSIVWLTTKAKLIEKISSRHEKGHCQLLDGDYNEFIRYLRATPKQIIGYIVIVQPALSKSAYMPDKIKEVLASASYYISKAGKVRGLEILGSS